MKTVDVLIEDEYGRRFIEMDGAPTEVPELVLTPWIPTGSGLDLFAVTHVPTGRCCNRGPLTLASALGFVHEVRQINWASKREKIVEELASKKQVVGKEDV